MNKQKIDLYGSTKDAVSEIAWDLIGISLILGIVCCLFAPVFSPFFEDRLHERHDTNHHYDRFPIVAREMLFIKAILWSISIVTWIFVIYCNTYK